MTWSWLSIKMSCTVDRPGVLVKKNFYFLLMMINDAIREKKFNFPLAEQKFIIINDEYLLQYWSIEYHNRYWHQWFRVKNLFNILNTLTFFLEKIENNDQFLFFLLFALDHHYHHQHNNNNDDAWCNFNDMFFLVIIYDVDE